MGKKPITGTWSLNSPYTLACRINFSAITAGQFTLLIAFDDGSTLGSANDGAYMFRDNASVTGTNMGFWNVENGGSTGASSIKLGSGVYANVGVWQHVCMVWDGSTVFGYLDGTQIVSGASATTLTRTTPTTMYIGPGLFSAVDVLITQRAMSAIEVQRLARGRKPESLTGVSTVWIPCFNDASINATCIDLGNTGNNFVDTSTGGTAPVVDTTIINPPTPWGVSLPKFVYVDPRVPLVGGNSSTTTAGTGTLSFPQALTGGNSNTQTAGTGTLATPTGLVGGNSRTITAGTGTLSFPQALTGGNSNTQTAGTGVLATPTGLTGGASNTQTAGTGTLSTPTGLVGANSNTTTAGSGTLSTPTALVGGNSRTITDGSGSLGTGILALVGGNSSTTTAGTGTLGTPTVLVGANSNTTTAWTGVLSFPQALVGGNSNTATAGTGTLAVVIPLFGGNSNTQTGGVGTLSTPTALIGGASATTTAGSGTLSGVTPFVPTGPGQGPGYSKHNLNRRNFVSSSRRTVRFGR